MLATTSHIKNLSSKKEEDNMKLFYHSQESKETIRPRSSCKVNLKSRMMFRYSHENVNPLRLKSSYAKNLGSLNSFNYSSNE